MPPKVALLSPFPPAPSGIADYSAELLPYLSRSMDLTLYVEGCPAEQVRLPVHLPVRPVQAFYRPEERAKYDLAIYQIGNSLNHEHTYHLALEHPGVVFLHDFVLHHFLAGITLDRGDFDAYRCELETQYGEEGRFLAVEILSGRLTPQERFERFMQYPLNRRLVRASRAVVCHSRYTQQLVQQSVPEALVLQANMGIDIPPHRTVSMARRRLKLPPGEFILASVGHITPTRRLDKALRAFARFHAEHPHSRYILVGQLEAHFNLPQLIAELGLEQAVTITGRVGMEDFQAYIQAADVCLNLRYPSTGETSAGVLRILAAARPVIVSDYASFQEIPDAACLKLPLTSGPQEEELLYRYLEVLSNSPEARRTLGENAHQYVLREHTLAFAANRYREIVEQVLTGETPSAAEPEPFLRAAPAAPPPKPAPSVWVIVLNYNGEHHLQDCLTSLLAQDYPNCHILLVDNASPDKSGEWAREHFPQVETLLLPQNLGFARGNNVGFARALQGGADYVLALNNDTAVEPDWLRRQVEVIEADPTIGACGARLMYFYHRPWINSLGHQMNQWSHTWDIGFGRAYEALRESEPSQWEEPFEVVSICGASYLIRREVVEKVGGFDPAYFAYYDDVDLSIRIRALGYRLVAVPAAVVYHKFSASFGHESVRKLSLCTRYKWHFLWSHFPWARVLHCFPRQVLHDLRTGFWHLRQGEPKFLLSTLRALASFLPSVPQLLRQRRMNRQAPRHDEFLQLLAPTNHVPNFYAPYLDYTQVHSAAQAITNRILMGVSDQVLGPGWLPQQAELYGPVTRRMGRTATAYLRLDQSEFVVPPLGGLVAAPNPEPPKGGTTNPNLILQLHLRCPFAYLGAPTVGVWLEGELLGQRKLGMEWETWQFSAPPSANGFYTVTLACDRLYPAEWTGELSDFSLEVNELSLLPADSVFVRPILSSPTALRTAAVQGSSAHPSQLLAEITVLEQPREALAPGEPFELVLQLKNSGDSTWIAKPLPNGGYVTLGAQLYSGEGQLLNMDFARMLLPQIMLPGDATEVTLAAAAPAEPGAYQLRLDLVSEQVRWFADGGSVTPMVPVRVQFPLPSRERVG